MGLKWLRLPAKAFILENLSVFAISECYRSTFDNEHLRRGHSFESTAVVSLIRLYHLNYCITYWTWAFAPSYHSGRKNRDALVVMACRAKLIFCSRHYRHDACAIASLHSCADHSMRLKDFGLASGMAHCRLECYSLLNSIQVSALLLTLCLFQSCQLCSLTRIGALVLCWWSDKTVQPLHYNLSLLSFFSPENMARLGVGDSPV